MLFKRFLVVALSKIRDFQKTQPSHLIAMVSLMSAHSNNMSDNENVHIGVGFRYLTSFCFILLFSIFTIFSSAASANNKEVANVLDTAESFFKSLDDKSFVKAWQYLTEKSKTTIVEDIFKAINKGETIFTAEGIADDMKNCAEICKGYWNGFLRTFSPNVILQQSKWEMGNITATTAEIKITYKKAQRPAILKMQKEQGKWKVGLVETFWSRK